MFEKKEWFHFIIAVFVMAFAFGFNDGKDEFIFLSWLVNMLWVLLMVFVSFFIYQLAQKTVAKMHGFKTEFKIWGIDNFIWHPFKGVHIKKENDFPKRFRLFGKDIVINSIPLGIILAIIVTIATNGKLLWLGISHYDLLIKRSKRLGRKFVNVAGYDEAKIALAGPFAAIVLMVIFKLLNNQGSFDQIIMINTWIAIFNMIPFFQFAGGKVWNGSRVLYVFSAVFIAAMAVLIHFLDVIVLLVVSGALALIVAIIFFVKRYVEN
ncbi:MAG: hypothetical protein ABIJ18_05085 [archaeon]